MKGVPTGTNSSPEIANLFLLYYELQFFQNKMKSWNTLGPALQSFLLTYSRFIDDIFAVTTDKEMTVFDNNDMQSGITFGDGEDGIFPMSLLNKKGEIIDKPLQIEGEEGREVNFLDETISIKNGRLRRTLYRKTDFIIVAGAPLSDRPNFPHHDSKLTIRSKYGVVTGEMVRFSRRVDTQTDFIRYTVMMIAKMIQPGYSRDRLLTKVHTDNG